MKKLLLTLILLTFVSLPFAAKNDFNVLKNIKSNYGNELFITNENPEKIGLYLHRRVFIFSSSLNENEVISDLNGKVYDSSDFKFIGMVKGLYFYTNKLFENKQPIDYERNYTGKTKRSIYIMVPNNKEFILLNGNILLSDIANIINAKNGAFIFSNKEKLIGILTKKNLKDLLHEIIFNLNESSNFDIGINSYFKGVFTKIDDMEVLYKKVKSQRKGWLGITYSISNDYVKIEKIISNSPAEKGDLRVGDIIVKIDGKKADVNNLVNVVKSKKPGSEIILVIKRHKKLITKKIILGERNLKFYKDIIIKQTKNDKKNINEKLEKLQEELKELKKEIEDK